MKANQQCQRLFSDLKGVGQTGLRGFVLPVHGTGHALEPVNCSQDHIDASVVELLTQARNANAQSFLTIFEATPERTRNWLVRLVAEDPSRILFVVRNQETGGFYGYMGLAYGNDDGTYIEADAIVRTESVAVRGLMKQVFEKMIGWVYYDLGIKEIWVRVLSDNPAIKFYEACGFVTHEIRQLFEIRDDSGDISALIVDSASGIRDLSHRTLTCMKYGK